MTIPAKSLQRQFKKKFNEYLRKMSKGHKVIAVMEPYTVDCPNCQIDTVRDVSANIYEESFIRPVNIFPGTSCQKKIYPVPFNVDTAPSGIHYDPSIIDPKPIKASVCPVCVGKGKLTEANHVCIIGLVTWDPKVDFLPVSAGDEGENICRIKTYGKNYAVCRDAKSFIVNGQECTFIIPPRLKGLGEDHITEMYLLTRKVNHNVSTKFDADSRINDNPVGTISDPAPSGTPDVPPTIPGDDVW